MKSTATFGFAAVAVSLSFLAPSARADIVHWAYDWTHAPNPVWAHKSHDDGITLISPGFHLATGSSDTIAVFLKPFSDEPSKHPAHFAHATYSLTMFILDMASHRWGNVTFHGFFTGSLSKSGVHLHNHFVGDKTETLHLGKQIYTVTIDYYKAPGPPGSHEWGEIGAHVHVRHNPAPPGLVLAGLGLPLIGGAMWWKRRNGGAISRSS
jgi:hypothetical protein